MEAPHKGDGGASFAFVWVLASFVLGLAILMGAAIVLIGALIG